MPNKQKRWADMRADSLSELRDKLREALEANGWNLTATAKALDVRPSTLQSLLGTYGLQAAYAAHARKPGRPRKDETK